MSGLLVCEDASEILRDAGCPDEFIQQFLSAMEAGNRKDQFRLLKAQRCRQLDKLHLEEKHLDILDYLRDQMERQEKDKAKKES